MTKVVIDMSISLDGFVAGPDDGKADPLGRHGGHHVFDWYFSGGEELRDPLFKPERGGNSEKVERMFAESGAFIFGRRTYEITDGWGGRHPVNGVPVFVLTHEPPAEYPRGPSNLTFVTDGIESAIRQPRAVSGGKDIKLGGASPGKPRGGPGRRDPDPPRAVPDRRRHSPVRPPARRDLLEKISVSDGPFATHLRYRVVHDPGPG